MAQTISIGCDHAGTDYKASLIKHLEAKGYTVINRGADGHDSVDYPDFAHPVAQDVETGAAQLGVLICGSANGVAITANKHQGIRAALCWNNDVAALARLHNDANIICLPARFISLSDALAFTDTFLNTDFEGGRHANRVNKIACR